MSPMSHSALSARLHVRPIVTTLEDRLAPSATVDLSQHGASGTINGAVFAQLDAVPTAQLTPFLTVKGRTANDRVQQGYNTDARPVQFDEVSRRSLTHSLKLSQVMVVAAN